MNLIVDASLRISSIEKSVTGSDMVLALLMLLISVKGIEISVGFVNPADITPVREKKQIRELYKNKLPVSFYAPATLQSYFERHSSNSGLEKVTNIRV
jgi:hypothetical protein